MLASQEIIWFLQLQDCQRLGASMPQGSLDSLVSAMFACRPHAGFFPGLRYRLIQFLVEHLAVLCHQSSNVG